MHIGTEERRPMKIDPVGTKFIWNTWKLDTLSPKVSFFLIMLVAAVVIASSFLCSSYEMIITQYLAIIPGSKAMKNSSITINEKINNTRESSDVQSLQSRGYDHVIPATMETYAVPKTFDSLQNGTGKRIQQSNSFDHGQKTDGQSNPQMSETVGSDLSQFDSSQHTDLSLLLQSEQEPHNIFDLKFFSNISHTDKQDTINTGTKWSFIGNIPMMYALSLCNINTSTISVRGFDSNIFKYSVQTVTGCATNDSTFSARLLKGIVNYELICIKPVINKPKPSDPVIYKPKPGPSKNKPKPAAHRSIRALREEIPFANILETASEICELYHATTATDITSNSKDVTSTAKTVGFRSDRTTSTSELFTEEIPSILTKAHSLTESQSSKAVSGLKYSNGPLLHNISIIIIFWNKQCRYQKGWINFYKNLISANFMSMFTEYSANSKYIGYSGRLSYTYINTATTTYELPSRAIESELKRLFNEGLVPKPTSNTLYQVHFPPVINLIPDFCTKLCGYHESFLYNGQNVYYSVIPDYSICGGTCGKNFGDMTSTASHEVAEAVTDAIPGNGWYDFVDNAEIGDLCVWQTVSVTIGTGVTVTVQKEWSNIWKACISPDTVSSGVRIYPNNCIFSPGGAYKLCYQYDGNLVMSNTNDGEIVWAMNVVNYSPGYCIMQDDGNFVCYDSRNQKKWATKTYGKGTYPYRLALQDDRNMVVYDFNNNAIWVSNTKTRGGCFPMNAVVNVLEKGHVLMRDLKYGDMVKVLDDGGTVNYREVYLFGHRDESVLSPFINLKVDNVILQITLTHYLRVCIAHCSINELQNNLSVIKNIYAKDVKIDDILIVIHDSNLIFKPVIAIWQSEELGLYNPYIRGGNIIVNNLVVSVHSEWILDDAVKALSLPYDCLPDIYEVIFLPIYLLFKLLGPEFSYVLATSLGIHKYDASSTSNAHVWTLAFLYTFLFSPCLFVVHRLLRSKNQI